MPQAFAKRQNKYLDMLYGANLYVAGWCTLRAGDYERAIQRLEESNGANWFGRGIAYPLLAIAYHKTGRAKMRSAGSNNRSRCWTVGWMTA